MSFNLCRVSNRIADIPKTNKNEINNNGPLMKDYKMSLSRESTGVNMLVASESEGLVYGYEGSGNISWNEGFGELGGVMCVVEDESGINIDCGLGQSDSMKLRSIVEDNYLREKGNV